MKVLETELPEIEYTSKEDKAILRWKYCWTEFLIYYYWETWHPCAYIKVDKWDNNYENYNSPCHWWITFADRITDNTKWNKWRFTSGYRIWRDYAHWWDYMRILWSWKQRTTQEILNDIRDMVVWYDKNF